MAPFTDQTLAGIQDLVNKLEARVNELETKLAKAGGDVSPRSTSEQVRMILMGPPGAGMRARFASRPFQSADGALQARAPKPHGSRTNSVLVIWWALPL